jgi:hypothetical protein
MTKLGFSNQFGLAYTHYQDYDYMMSYIKKAIENGESPDMKNNPAKAIEWYKKAIQNGDP